MPAARSFWAAVTSSSVVVGILSTPAFFSRSVLYQSGQLNPENGRPCSAPLGAPPTRHSSSATGLILSARPHSLTYWSAGTVTPASNQPSVLSNRLTITRSGDLPAATAFSTWSSMVSSPSVTLTLMPVSAVNAWKTRFWAAAAELPDDQRVTTSMESLLVAWTSEPQATRVGVRARALTTNAATPRTARGLVR